MVDFTSPAAWILLLGAAGTAVAHTLAGPDHYLPFIVMGRARRWSALRTIGWTTLCGLGHVGSSVVIAVVGVLLGLGLERVEAVEAWRGQLAAWGMILFGLAYLAWGLWHSRRPHQHGGAAEGFRLTPWVLFIIFVLGPCEPMIPLVMYPAMQGTWTEVAGVVVAFSGITIASMLAVILLAAKSLSLVRLRPFERHSHAIAGATILAAGCAIQFLGL